MSNSIDITDIVAVTRYPIHDLQCADTLHLIKDCQQQLSNNGLCLLPEFITTDALAAMQDTANALLTSAHHTQHWRATPNGDQQSSTSTLAVATRASMSSIGYDQLHDTENLRLLYSSSCFTAFVNAIFDGPELHITDDPLIGCMLTAMSDGDELGWHYDPNDIVVSLLLQAPLAGGEFEFAPRIRRPTPGADINEAAVLAGNYHEIISKQLKPGTLSLFNGHQSLHRVSPVIGERQRIVALFNYSEVPYYSFDQKIHTRFFGRVAD